MTDIVERLRHNSGWMQPNHHDLAHEAADEIERLTALCRAQGDTVKLMDESNEQLAAEIERLRAENAALAADLRTALEANALARALAALGPKP